MSYSRKKTNGGSGHTFLKETLDVFWFFSVPLEVSGKTKPQPWKFGKIMYVTSLASFKAKKQDSRKFHMNFSCSTMEILCFFYITSENSTCEIPLEILYISLTTVPPCLDFFKSSPISTTLCLVQTLSHKNKKNLPPNTGWLFPSTDFIQCRALGIICCIYMM